MEPTRLKREFGKDLVFWGGIDIQKVLPFGTVKEVRDKVKRMIDTLAPDGGYILTPCHNIQANTPPENVLEMFEAAIDYS
jgi:uroporphyrinogen decarboxylase